MEWSKIYERSSPDLNSMISNPDEWQIDLAKKIRSLVGNGTLLEAGCGYGVTSLLVGEAASRTLLDIEPKAMEIAQELYRVAEQRAAFVVGDLFKIDFPDNSFDVTFNAGVFEHFDFQGRVAALAEMTRVTKPGGKIIIAVPNHYSVPYRFSYCYRKARGSWPYPDEEKIFDLSAEIREADGTAMVAREIVATETIFYFLTKPQRILFRVLHALKEFEGYLTVLIHEKKS